MNSFQNKYDSIENLIYTEGLKISSVNFSNSLDQMFVYLNNELTFIIPTQFFLALKNANQANLKNYKLIAEDTGIYWPDLDEDLSLKGFLKDYLKQKIHTEKQLVII